MWRAFCKRKAVLSRCAGGRRGAPEEDGCRSSRLFRRRRCLRGAVQHRVVVTCHVQRVWSLADAYRPGRSAGRPRAACCPKRSSPSIGHAVFRVSNCSSFANLSGVCTCAPVFQALTVSELKTSAGSFLKCSHPRSRQIAGPSCGLVSPLH